jgi:chromosomal replication initiation ATPase DnaA
MDWKEKHKREIDKLFESISQKFLTTKEDLISKYRRKNLVIGRRFFMAVVSEVFKKENVTCSEVSSLVNRDRTSFMHSMRVHSNHYNSYKSYRQDYDTFKREYVSFIDGLNK